MAQSILSQYDSVRTEQLAINEIFVLKGKGDQSHYFTRREDDWPECCPQCGGTRFKKQNLFSRSYSDCLMLGSKPQIVSLVYSFYKYRCLNPECRHIFTPEISFATVNDNVTYRLENKIADMVIAEESYGSIAASFQNQLSRQAIGQIFNRWVRHRNDCRMQNNEPSVVGIITGLTDKGEYTLILSCDDSIRVLDILYGIDSGKIISSVRRFSGRNTAFVLTDCDPVVYAAAKEALPLAIHIIPAEMWLKLVRNDFSEFARPYLKWVNVTGKERFILEAKAANAENVPYELQRIFNSRPDLQEPYNDYHYLRSTITNRTERWYIKELDDWPDTIDNSFRQQLDISLLIYQEYRCEIAVHQDHWDKVPINLLSTTDRLEELIRARRTFSEEALQAAVLYSTAVEPTHWQGIDIDDVIDKLTELQEHNWRKVYAYE